MEIISKAKGAISTVKEYWSVLPKGKNIPYKEVAAQALVFIGLLCLLRK